METPSSKTRTTTRKTRRKSCEDEQCLKQPAFSFNGSSVRFCAVHRLRGMVNVRNRRCEEQDCAKEPYFGQPGGKARFCATHRPDKSMIDVRHRRCKFVSCRKQPNYGYEGKRACYCAKHKLPTMVDVKHRRCAEAGCRLQSFFAFPGTKKKFCTAHRRDGMLPSGRTPAPTAAHSGPSTRPTLATSLVAGGATAVAGSREPAPISSSLAANDGSVTATAAARSPAPSRDSHFLLGACDGDTTAAAGPPPAPQPVPCSLRSNDDDATTSEARGMPLMTAAAGQGEGEAAGRANSSGGCGGEWRRNSWSEERPATPRSMGKTTSYIDQCLSRSMEVVDDEDGENTSIFRTGSGGGPPRADSGGWRRRSCPPVVGTAAVAYIRQQQRRPPESFERCEGHRHPHHDRDTDHRKHSLFRSLSAGQQHFTYQSHYKQQQVRQQDREQRLRQGQTTPLLLLPFPLGFDEAARSETPAFSSSRPWGSSASSSYSAATSSGNGSDSPGGGEPWPRAAIASAGASDSAWVSAAPAVEMGDGPPFHHHHHHRHQHGEGRGRERVGRVGSSIRGCSGSVIVSGVRYGNTAAETDFTTKWADTAMVSRRLPTLDGLSHPSSTAFASAATCDGNESGGTLNPHWRSGLPKKWRSPFSTFLRRPGGDNGSCSGVVWKRQPSSLTSAATVAAGAVTPEVGGPAAIPPPPTPQSTRTSSWSKPFSAIVTLGGGRNSNTRLARLYAAAGGGGDHDFGLVGPTLEALEMES